MMTFVPEAPPPPPVLVEVAALLELPPLLVDLLLEHPERPAARIAAPATATVSPRFTCAPLPS
ncbi:hypothetical protein I547_2883 [Mycobacterium kansasii 824]|nr:hypothetical protein I547_2883 [Mycobacterium kansasii 824]